MCNVRVYHSSWNYVSISQLIRFFFREKSRVVPLKEKKKHNNYSIICNWGNISKWPVFFVTFKPTSPTFFGHHFLPFLRNDIRNSWRIICLQAYTSTLNGRNFFVKDNLELSFGDSIPM